MLQLSIALFGLGVLMLAVFDMIQGYRAAEGGTFVERIKCAFRYSSTVFVSQVSLIALGAPVVAANLADYLGDPAVAQAISVLSPYVPGNPSAYVPAAVALLTLVARMRTAK